MSAIGRRFLDRLRTALRDNIADRDFGVAELATAASQDRSHLFRRTRELLGEAPSDLIRRLRLERAARLLAREDLTVSEVAQASGFRSVSYFCRAFRQANGVTPSEHRRRSGRASCNRSSTKSQRECYVSNPPSE